MSITSKSSKRNFGLIHILFIVLLLIVVAGGVFGYSKYNDLKDQNQKLSNPQESAKLETDKIKSEISSIIELPSDEEPTIATVSDVSKLGNQPFFSKAQNGDKLIMYSKSKKAILYRPSTKKIIEVAPINLGEPSKDKTTTTQPSQENPATPDPNLAQQPGIQQ